MNDNLIALLEELNSYGMAYIELDNENIIEVMVDGCAEIAKFRVATKDSEKFNNCEIREVTNLLEVHQVKEIR